MDYSSRYKRRLQLLRKEEIPFLSEITEEWGKLYCDMFCENCEESLKYYIGIKPPLQGAGDELWISPSDVLAGKVQLKPPPTSKHMFALSHKGVLEIGMDLEMKYKQELELEKKRALKEQALLHNFEYQRELERALADLIAKERERCNDLMDQMREEFAKRLAEELANLQAMMQRETDLLYEEKTQKIEEQWQLRLEEVVGATIANLTKAFLESLQEHANDLEFIYVNLLKKERIKSQFEIDMERIRCSDIMKQLRHNLECNNIANMMYVICMERRKCQTEMATTENRYKQELSTLRSMLVNKEMEVSAALAQRDDRLKELQIREKCVLEIMRQFQRFISFALRETPSRANFLVNVEKMLLLELTNVIKRAAPLARAAGALEAVRSKSFTLSKSSSKTASKSDAVTAESLPLPVYYDEKTYVREDFGRLVSEKMTVAPNSLLWNKDVEHFMEILRAQAQVPQDDQPSEQKPADESRSATRSDRMTKSASQPHSRRSSVHFHRHGEALGKQSSSRIGSSMICGTLKMNLSSYELDRSKSSFLRPNLKYSSDKLGGVTYSKIGEAERQKSILSARNSLELINEKFDADAIVEEEEQIKGVEELTVDTLIEQPITSMESNVTLRTIDSLQKYKKTVTPLPIVDSTSERISIKTSLTSLTTAPKETLQSPELQNVIDFDSKLIAVQDSVELLQEKTSLKMKSVTSSQSSLKKTKEDAMFTDIINMDSKLNVTHDSFHLIQEKLSAKDSFKKSPAAESGKSPRGSVVRRDSLELARESLRSITSHPKKSQQLIEPQAKISKLSMTRNSIELMRDPQRLSKHKASTLDTMRQSDSVEIMDGLIKTHISRNPSVVIKLDDAGDRSVRMSHIEVVEIEKRGVSDEFFGPPPVAVDDFVAHDSVHKVYLSEETDSRKGKKSRDERKHVKKIKGKKAIAKEDEDYDSDDEESEVHDIDSMLNVLRSSPSLLRMFTAVVR